MHHIRSLSLVLAMAALSAAHAADLVILNTNIVDVERGTILRNQTLSVSDGLISDISTHRKSDTLPGASVVDGTGRYLLPALWDMHVHPNRESDLKLFMANGVGGVRIMSGTAEHLAWRARIELGEMPGPRLLIAGPIVEGIPPPEFANLVVTAGRRLVKTEADGIAEVRRQAAAGFDYIKVYNNVPRDAYAGVISEAARQGLPVIGHVPFAVGLEGALAARQASIEHLRGYVEMLVPRGAPIEPAADVRSRTLAWQYADLSRLGNVVKTTLTANSWQTPTLSTQLYHATMKEVDAYLASPEAQFLDAQFRSMLLNRTAVPFLRNFKPGDFELAMRGLEKQYVVLRAMHEAGVPLLAGTDVMPWGFSLHSELELLTRAGVSNRESLETATLNPARFAGLESHVGRVSVGYAADLLILDADPLADIRSTRKIHAVILRGTLLDRRALDGLLKEVQTEAAARSAKATAGH